MNHLLNPAYILALLLEFIKKNVTKCLNATCLIYSSLYKKNTVQLFILVLTMKLRSVSGSVILFWEDELFCHFPSECFILYIGVYILVNLNATVPIVHVFLE